MKTMKLEPLTQPIVNQSHNPYLKEYKADNNVKIDVKPSREMNESRSIQIFKKVSKTVRIQFLIAIRDICNAEIIHRQEEKIMEWQSPYPHEFKPWQVHK